MTQELVTELKVKGFICETYKSLMSLAEGNAGIGLKEKGVLQDTKVRCRYGVGLGYYEATITFRDRAINANLITPKDIPEANYREFQRHSKEIALELGAVNLPIGCPLDQHEQGARNSVLDHRTAQNDGVQNRACRDESHTTNAIASN